MGKTLSIDSLHGLVSISHDKPHDIHLQTIESAKLNLISPLSNVRIGHLKSLHDHSLLVCDNLDLTISDN